MNKENITFLFSKLKLPPNLLQSQFISNLIIGVILAVSVTALQGIGIRWIVSLESGAIDWIMSMHRGSVSSDISTPLAYIDIDEKTYEYWNEPFYSPRSDLKKAIEIISNSQPKGVILDIDLSRQGFDKKDDQILVDYLKNYDVKAPPLILIRSFTSNSLNQRTLLKQKKSTIPGLEEIIQDKPNITWASTLFPIDVDGVVRRWRLWELSCLKNNVDIVLSVQLLIAGIENNLTFKKLKEKFQKNIIKDNARSCNDFNIKNNSKLKPIQLGKLKIRKSENSIEQRIIYSIPWKSRVNNSSMMLDSDGQFVQLFTSRSILPFVKQMDIDTSWLKNRIIVIGSSYAESKDIYMTPIGYMPGSMILINSINSLNGYGLIERPDLPFRILILFLLIGIVTVIFSIFSTFTGFIISSIIILISFVPFSYFLFSNGIWLDFALPIFAVQLHELILALKDEFKKSD